jgi:hypothetical protein
MPPAPPERNPVLGGYHWKTRSSDPWSSPISLPQRLALTFDTGLKGTAQVNDTLFDSRTPDTTVVHFTGTSPLA